MSWPGTTIVETNLDDTTDSPASARADLLDAVQKLNTIIGARDTASGVAGLDAGGKISNTKLPNTLISSASSNLTLDPDTGVVVLQDILQLTGKTTAQLNALTGVAGQIAYCTDGDTGDACLAVYDGSTWSRITLGSAISAP